MSEPQSYSAKDIERYHRGGMTAAEMHLLEKAALDDPMLADALEGYTYTGTASADLQSLQGRLQKRIEEDSKKRVLIFGSPWLKVAALFLLLAGSGWLVFQTFSGKRNDLATNTTSEAQNIQKNLPAQSTDSAVPSVSAPLNNITASITDSVKKNQDLVMERAKPSVTKKTKIVTIPAAQSKIEIDTALGKNDGYVALGRRMSAIKESEQSNQEAIVPSARFKKMPDTNRASADTATQHVNVVLKRIDTPVDEVVISKAKQAPRARGVPIVIDTLEPEEGWSSFNDYVAENLKAPTGIKTKQAYEKAVELSFDVDSEGNPVNVKVTKSLCEKCDAEAIRLLKEGPKWKGKKTKGKVTIKFPSSP